MWILRETKSYWWFEILLVVCGFWAGYNVGTMDDAVIEAPPPVIVFTDPPTVPAK